MSKSNYTIISALAFVVAIMVSCSKDNDNDNDNASNIVTFTTTVGFEEGDEATKALTSGGLKTFAEGDQIAVVYTNTSSETVVATSSALTSSDITNEGKSASFTVTLTDPAANGSYKYIYPASMARSSGSINYSALYSNQDGTLDSLASTFDLAVYEGTMTSGKELTSGVLSNKLAILAITLKDNDGSNNITSSITNLKLTTSDNTYDILRTTTNDTIYVAIRDLYDDITITASDGTNGYRKTLEGKTYDAGSFYNVKWRMSKSTLGQVICTDGSIYTSVSAATAASKNAVAKVIYLGSDTGDSNYTNGLAFALSDEGSMDWGTALSACANKNSTSAVPYAYWMLPSCNQWTTMISAAGSGAALRDGFESVGGTDLQWNYYYTSTGGEYDDKAYTISFSSGYDYEEGYTYDEYYVRACLVF